MQAKAKAKPKVKGGPASKKAKADAPDNVNVRDRVKMRNFLRMQEYFYSAAPRGLKDFIFPERERENYFSLERSFYDSFFREIFL